MAKENPMAIPGGGGGAKGVGGGVGGSPQFSTVKKPFPQSYLYPHQVKAFNQQTSVNAPKSWEGPVKLDWWKG